MLDPAQFKLVIDSLMWGMKHNVRDISDVSLACVHPRHFFFVA
jgi:hypothetical protein